MRGPIGSHVAAAPTSQHVPMSPRARTAADIIIVYSRRPRGGCCIALSPLYTPWLVTYSWVKVASVRTQCVVRACCEGVSSPRSDSVDSATLCVNAAGCDAHCPTSLHASTPDDRACSSEDFGERRANTSDNATWPRATTIWFRSRGDCRWSRTRDEDLGS